MYGSFHEELEPSDLLSLEYFGEIVRERPLAALPDRSKLLSDWEVQYSEGILNRSIASEADPTDPLSLSYL